MDKKENLKNNYFNNVFNLYLAFILFIFIFNIAHLFTKKIVYLEILDIKDFVKFLVPSIINIILFIVIKHINKKRGQFPFELFSFVFLISSYSFIFLYDYLFILMIFPIFLLLDSIIFLDKKMIIKEGILIIICNLIVFMIEMLIFKKDFLIIFIDLLFSSIVIFGVGMFAIFIINYMKVLYENTERAYKKQEILNLNLNKAINDLKIEPMTGLFNKRAMNEAIDVKINNFNRFKKMSFIVIIDLDHFKNVNDTYGHNIGDKVLMELSDLLKTKLKNKANAFRFGGEEFVIIFDKYTETEVYEIIEDIRITFNNKVFTYMDNKHLSLSAGIAGIIKDDSKEAFLKRADDALYYSKEHGRNQVNIYNRIYKN